MSLARQHPRVALAILGAFTILSAGYSIINPVFESPDEVYHYPYIKHIADGRGLPVQRRDHKEFWEQEGSQPPLYYALSAALTFWIDADDLPTVRYLNPHARIGVSLARDNKNMVIHTDREKLPWRGTVLAVHLIRFFSVILGAGTVWCSYRLALSLFPHRPTIAICAMLLNAFIPMFVFVSGSVNNDNLVILLSTVALLLLIRILRQGPANRRLLTLGIVIGLACLSKLSALALVPLMSLALAVQRLQTMRRADEPSVSARSLGLKVRRWIRECVIVCIPVVLVAGWWYARNWHLYGDPLGINTMLDIFGRRKISPSPLELLSEFEGMRISFWGLFGVVNVLLRPHWIYRLLDAFGAWAVVGFVVRLVRAWHARRLDDWPALFVLAAWIGAVCVSLIRWTMMTKASQGRLIYPAISAICLFVALGVLQWFPRRHWPRVVGGMAIPLVLLAVTAPFTAIRPAYARPPILTVDDVPASARFFNATYGGVMRLLAHEVGEREVRPGDSFPVTLYWESLAPMDEDYSIYIHVFGHRGQRLGQRDSYPGGGAYPTSMWSPGEVIRDTFLVPIRADAVGPVAAEVVVGLYRWKTMAPLPAADPQGNPVGKPVIARIKVAVPTPEHEPAHLLDINLDGRVRLIGYDLDATQARAGEALSLTLYWQVTGTLEQDYMVFIHLLDEEETLAGQGDGPPLENGYPTSFWGAGETLADTHQLIVREDAQPGIHRIFVGLYDLTTGQRLPVLNTRGNPEGDRALVTAIRVLED